MNGVATFVRKAFQPFPQHVKFQEDSAQWPGGKFFSGTDCYVDSAMVLPKGTLLFINLTHCAASTPMKPAMA